jgi:Xaa-Pro aminopeptidase
MQSPEQKALREAIDQANGVLSAAAEAARTAGVSERYIADMLRKRVMTYAKPPPPPMSEEEWARGWRNGSLWVHPKHSKRSANASG